MQRRGTLLVFTHFRQNKFYMHIDSEVYVALIALSLLVSRRWRQRTELRHQIEYLK